MASTLTAFCDLEFCPVSFDFVTWLVRAKFEQEQRGLDKLHVVIVPYEKGLGGFSRHWGEHDEAATRWRLWHIVIPACQLAGATVTLAADRKQASSLKADPFWWEPGKQHFIYPLVDAARSGKKIPKLRATEQACKYVSKWGRYVTLTVRDQSTHKDRNSNRGEWCRFLESLTVPYVWLDDTNKALSSSWGRFPEIDIDLRLALYERASMNFIGNNGPSIMLQCSDAPYRIFLDKAWPEHWKQYFHMEIGEQFPWANANQRIVYEPDTFEVMRDSWQ